MKNKVILWMVVLACLSMTGYRLYRTYSEFVQVRSIINERN